MRYIWSETTIIIHMNKSLAILAATAIIGSAALSFSSCSSSKKVAPALSTLNGEWSVVAIDSEPVTSPEAKETTYLGFNTGTGELYGNASCNMLTGRFATDAAPGTLDLGKVGATQMMCPDMTVENALLGALSTVKGYKAVDDDNRIALTDADGKEMVLLERRNPAVEASALQGEWNIKEINGEPTDSLPGAPYTFVFGNQDGKDSFSATTDCNNLMGGYTTSSQSISFGPVASTRMACPDNTVERTLIELLPRVASFGKLAGGGIGLYDADNNMLLLLDK